jgi:hypothetical protein
MIIKKWAEFLFITYTALKNSPQWNEIESGFDEEDKAYFNMLGQKKIPISEWPNKGDKFEAWSKE